jgi:D-tyrosyl-tRNA(Tyr) deacylase
MRMLVQKVKQAKVLVEGKVVGAIGKGLCVFVGFSKDEDDKALPKSIEKLLGLRIFPNEEGKMHTSALDAKASVLVVSQFTLYAEFQGKRPSFTNSMPSCLAEDVYKEFVQELRRQMLPYQDSKLALGVFGAHMEVDLINDGPLTFLIDTVT